LRTIDLPPLDLPTAPLLILGPYLPSLRVYLKLPAPGGPLLLGLARPPLPPPIYENNKSLFPIRGPTKS